MSDNLLSAGEFKRLTKSVASSRRRMQTFRENRLSSIRQIVGARYGEQGGSEKFYMPMTKTAVNIWRRQLIVQEPRVLVAPKLRGLRFEADLFAAAMNQDLKDMNFADSVIELVTEALILDGIIMIGVAEDAAVEIDGERLAVGQPYAAVLDYDDWVQDMNARTSREFTYCGHRYWRNLDEARENPRFSKKARERLSVYEQPQLNEAGDERASVISGGDRWSDDEYEEQVALWDIYLPRKQLIVTYAVQRGEDGSDELSQLEVRDWRGPINGPYRKLSYGYVPGNAVPSPPVETLYEMDKAFNRIFRKLINQAMRQKTVVGYRGDAKDDAEREKNAGDGEMIQMDNPESVREFRTGGADGENLAFVLQMRQLISYLGGNLDILGGLTSQADTATQEKIMAESASQMVNEMQDATQKAVRDIVNDLAWYRWHDPIRQTYIQHDIAGIEETFAWPFAGDVNPAMPADLRQGRFDQYRVDIEPYSMVGRSPAERLNAIQSSIERLYMPLMQLGMEQGISIDMHELFRLTAEYSGVPELSGVFTYQEPQAAEQFERDEQPKQSPVTRREHVRINRSGASQRGAEQALTQVLMGGRPQQAEAAAIGRPA